MSVKFQMTLPADLAARLKSQAERYGVPLAEFIRETMAARLNELDERRQGPDPLASITGISDAAETDLAERVDEVLYG